MKIGCALSFQALIKLLSLIKDTKSRKPKAFVLLRSSRSRRFSVERRAPNVSRNRWRILQKIAHMSDAFFKRYFRLDRESFYSLLETIEPRISRNTTRALNSSGSHVLPAIKLALALRFLAGGIYLDLAFVKHNMCPRFQSTGTNCIRKVRYQVSCAVMGARTHLHRNQFGSRNFDARSHPKFVNTIVM